MMLIGMCSQTRVRCNRSDRGLGLGGFDLASSVRADVEPASRSKRAAALESRWWKSSFGFWRCRGARVLCGPCRNESDDLAGTERRPRRSSIGIHTGVCCALQGLLDDDDDEGPLTKAVQPQDTSGLFDKAAEDGAAGVV